MNVYPTIYPVCHTKTVAQKLVKILGLGLYVVHCNRAMPLKNCYIEMNINFHLKKQGQHLSVTAFPKIVGNKDNINDLTEKLLLFKNVDFELSQNNKLVVNMKSHTSSSQRK